MEETTKNLVLIFGTDTNESVRITVSAPKETLTNEEIATIMDNIIAAKALGGNTLISTKVSAKYVTKEVTEIKIGA